MRWIWKLFSGKPSFEISSVVSFGNTLNQKHLFCQNSGISIYEMCPELGIFRGIAFKEEMN